MNIPSNERLERCMEKEWRVRRVFTALAENFKKRYGHDEAEFFHHLAEQN